MNRLTRSIGLVLIASSLGLHGCSNDENDDDRKDDRQNWPSGTSSRGWQYYGGGHLGSDFGHAGTSARGGFGASAHGGGS